MEVIRKVEIIATVDTNKATHSEAFTDLSAWQLLQWLEEHAGVSATDLVKDHLHHSLTSDEARSSFLSGLGICLLCGSTSLPCYCAPMYDE